MTKSPKSGLRTTGSYKESTKKKLACINCGRVHRIAVESKFTETTYRCYKCLHVQKTDCMQCGNNFFTKYDMICFCSEECRKQHDNNAGNYAEHGACGCGHTVKPKPFRGIYCTDKCAKKFQN